MRALLPSYCGDKERKAGHTAQHVPACGRPALPKGSCCAWAPGAAWWHSPTSLGPLCGPVATLPLQEPFSQELAFPYDQPFSQGRCAAIRMHREARAALFQPQRPPCAIPHSFPTSHSLLFASHQTCEEKGTYQRGRVCAMTDSALQEEWHCLCISLS